MRNGLLQKNKDKSAASGKESSRLTIFRRSSLRGRFKLNDEQKAETRKRDSPGSSSRSLSGRPETIREASSSVVSESESQAEALAEILAETQGETPAETELAVQPTRPSGISPACYETATPPPLLRGPGSPEMPEHRNCLKQRVDPFISLCKSLDGRLPRIRRITNNTSPLLHEHQCIEQYGDAEILWVWRLRSNCAAFCPGNCRHDVVNIPAES